MAGSRSTAAATMSLPIRSPSTSATRSASTAAGSFANASGAGLLARCLLVDATPAMGVGGVLPPTLVPVPVATALPESVSPSVSAPLNRRVETSRNSPWPLPPSPAGSPVAATLAAATLAAATASAAAPTSRAAAGSAAVAAAASRSMRGGKVTRCSMCRRSSATKHSPGSVVAAASCVHSAPNTPPPTPRRDLR